MHREPQRMPVKPAGPVGVQQHAGLWLGITLHDKRRHLQWEEHDCVFGLLLMGTRRQRPLLSAFLALFFISQCNNLCPDNQRGWCCVQMEVGLLSAIGIVHNNTNHAVGYLKQLPDLTMLIDQRGLRERLGMPAAAGPAHSGLAQLLKYRGLRPAVSSLGSWKSDKCHLVYSCDGMPDAMLPEQHMLRVAVCRIVQ